MSHDVSPFLDEINILNALMVMGKVVRVGRLNGFLHNCIVLMNWYEKGEHSLAGSHGPRTTLLLVMISMSCEHHHAPCHWGCAAWVL